MNKFRWIEPPAPDGDAVAGLSAALGVPPAGARLLVARSLGDADAARRFLEPSAGQSHDPFLFENMREAVARVERAVRSGASILVHGDYDVDGISGTALLFQYLDGVGAGEVFRFVPDRRRDGYGVAARAVDWAIEHRVGLVIAVDCGSSDADLIGKLEDHGIDVVVCDHHELPADGRTRGVLLNPSRPDETYPFRSLCGTSVAFKLVEALHRSGVRGRRRPESLLDLVALATVGDLCPLVGENRELVQRGLERINGSPRPGVDALKGVARLRRSPVTAGHIAFMLAPRLNAPGRVSRPKPALEILCTEDKAQALQLAAVLDGENERRKELTRRVEDDALAQIRALTDLDARGAFVLHGRDWDEGVLGIAASRVVEEFGRPAILVSVGGALAKGSGRSVPGVDLKHHLDAFSDSFVRYGGHAQAVGLTMEADKLARFADGFADRLREFVTPGDGRRLQIDAALDLEECSDDLLAFIDRCEPFGYGNRQPVWKLTDVQVSRNTTIVGENHMKLFFQDGRGVPGEAIAFRWTRPETPEDLHGRVVDLAVSVRRGEYNGRVYPELRLIDIRHHRPDAP